MWKGRAGRGCAAAGSSGGAIRRQPKNVFNVNFSGPPDVAATYAANATARFLPRKFYTVCYAVLRNSEETQQVGFASIKKFSDMPMDCLAIG
jgi:hypothetical protein